MAATTLAAGVAAAQAPPDLVIDQSKPYRHELSGLTIPLTLDGLPRIKAGAFAPAHLDEDFNFNTPDMSEDITVFVFRNVSGSASLWFDRVATTVAARDIFGGVTPVTPAAAFTPPGQSTASGLLATWRPGGGRDRSTGAAFMRLGSDWYIEVRYSSATIDAAAMDGHLRSAMAALGWPAGVAAQPPAAPIAGCAAPLALSGQAERVALGKDDAMASVLANALSTAAANLSDKPGAAPRIGTRWCRDAGTYELSAQHGVYRPAGTNDQYLLAFGDAGRALWVAPNTLGAAIAGDRGKPASPRWSLSLADVAATANYADRDRLPPPDQAFQIARTEAPVSRVTTWGPKHDVRINSDSAK